MLRSISATLMLVLLGCGPSLRMEHQSATFFERCHATDADPRATVQQRRACWTAWTRYYADDQAPERVEYAQTRRDALERGESLAPLPGLGPAVDEQYTTSYLALSVDTGADAASAPESANVAEQATPSAEGVTESGQARVETPEHATTPSPPSSASDSGCNGVCRPRWTSCAERCEGEGRDCIGACEVNYRTCLGGCY